MVLTSKAGSLVPLILALAKVNEAPARRLWSDTTLSKLKLTVIALGLFTRMAEFWIFESCALFVRKTIS